MAVADAVTHRNLDSLPRRDIVEGGTARIEREAVRVSVVGDAIGQVIFTTIFPACYSGRMPHIHVEIYASLADAVVESKALKVTQLAFDRATCATIYSNATGYSASVANLAAISFASDNVFNGDSAAQLAAASVSLTGDYASGFTGQVTVATA